MLHPKFIPTVSTYTRRVSRSRWLWHADHISVYDILYWGFQSIHSRRHLIHWIEGEWDSAVEIRVKVTLLRWRIWLDISSNLESSCSKRVSTYKKIVQIYLAYNLFQSKVKLTNAVNSWGLDMSFGVIVANLAGPDCFVAIGVLSLSFSEDLKGVEGTFSGWGDIGVRLRSCLCPCQRIPQLYTNKYRHGLDPNLVPAQQTLRIDLRYKRRQYLVNNLPSSCRTFISAAYSTLHLPIRSFWQTT